ncbi:GNAT family N-acetyltransferase [Natronorarus salvus]|uniref:GNAT family N-acetyltransferase n=1 Tax=Natronorarus salvus TaxID=3117733 RepID=UPI002F263BF3
MASEIRVRVAERDDELDVRRVLNAAMLEFDAFGERIRSEDVLVAVETGREERGEDRAVLGALALSGVEIEAIAVRRARRNRGIGRALVESAGERQSSLTAEFDPDVREFYEALGFEIESIGDDRFRGVLRGDP